jgi:ADP-heptose:LPS heptosyltransferase
MRSALRNIVDNLIKFESLFIKKERTTNKRLLIFRKDGLGDYIIFLPVLKYYRDLFPCYEITLVVSKIAQELTPKIQGVDKFIILDNKKFSRDFLYRRRFFFDIIKSGYETIIYPVFSPEITGDTIVSASRAKTRIGFDGDYSYTKKGDHSKNVYTQLVKVPEDITTEFERNVFFARSLGASIDMISFPTIKPSQNDLDQTEILIRQNNLGDKTFCIIFPGAGQTYKIWPADRYVEIIDYLRQKEIIPVICGSKSDTAVITDIIDGLSDKDTVINLAGKTDLGTLTGLLSKSTFYFGSDTGILHLAVATGTPAICLMGGGHFRRFFPYGDLTKNLIIYNKDMKCLNDNWLCSKNLKAGESAPCIMGIKTKDAKEAIEKLLKIR